MRLPGLSCGVAFFAIALALADCNGGGTSPVVGSQPYSQPGSGSSPSPIQHVVLMIQENRTFNDFFATFPNADGTTTAQAVTNTNCSPAIYGGQIALTKENLILAKDLDHQYAGYKTADDKSKMDSFDDIKFGNGIPECSYPYQYTDPGQIEPYWAMASQYTLAEHMFTTQGSDSFTAHQDLIRGGTVVEPNKAMVDLPGCSGSKCFWGCDAPPHTKTHLITNTNKYVKKLGPFPCSNKFSVSYPTMRDLLDGASPPVSWKYYVPPSNTNYGKLMSAFDLVYPVRYGPEWTTNISTPETNIFNDISGGTLPAVSWVIPEAQNSDHPGEAQDNGPQWVASVVNAIGQSSYWNSTAVVIVWDDWGGLYDNVAPPILNYGGLGFRVPAIIVSPYARAGYISPTQYEFGSILKYIEETFGLGSLGTSDQRATSIGDCFNYLQSPIPFQPIPSSLNKSYFLHEKHSYRPIDNDM
jgi:phospholipase C